MTQWIMTQSFDAAACQNGIFSSVWGVPPRHMDASTASNLIDALIHDAASVTHLTRQGSPPAGWASGLDAPEYETRVCTAAHGSLRACSEDSAGSSNDAARLRHRSSVIMGFRHSPRGRDWYRIVELKVYRTYQSDDEEAELIKLRTKFPKSPSDSDLARAINLKLAELKHRAK